MRVMRESLAALPEDARFDVVVIGAGGAGLSAALFAALEGLQVLVVERTQWVGGSTAWSAGTSWIPGTRHAAAVNPADTLAEAARYLDHAVGPRSPAALRQAFLDHGAEAVERVETHTELHYRPYAKHPDYISDLPGATLNGRALEPVPFDGRLLGPLFGLLRPPIPEFTVLGGMMVDRTDINHLLGMTRSFASLRHAAGLLWRHARDRLSHQRGTRLVMGNALVGRLLYSLSKHEDVTLLLDTEMAQIGQGPDGVDSVTLAQGGQRRRVAVSKGLLLASGGFNRHPQRREQWLPGVPAAWCPGAPGHTGMSQDLALQVGAQLGPIENSPAFWAPVSLRQRPDGSHAVFPHFVMDRAKPGMLTVNAAGQRFVNESTSYHLFALAMQRSGMPAATDSAAAAPSAPATAVPAYLVCDARALRTYGLGMVRPGGKGLATYLADGYLTEGATLDELARKLGVEAGGLADSVARLNAAAATGKDTDFQRGETAYERNLGDPAWPGKNPNLGALREAPYYALRLYPGDIGAATGLLTTAHAQVLDAAQQPIQGLYAIGNDMQSIFGGVYAAPGITLGPGLVFASLAIRHVAKHRTNFRRLDQLPFSLDSAYIEASFAAATHDH